MKAKNNKLLPGKAVRLNREQDKQIKNIAKQYSITYSAALRMILAKGLEREISK